MQSEFQHRKECSSQPGSVWGLVATLFSAVLLNGCAATSEGGNSGKNAHQLGAEGLAGVMVTIPAGNFVMGDDRSSQPDERPAHNVHVGAFRLAKYEVTREQFLRFVNASSYRNTTPCWGWEGQNLTNQRAWSWQDPGFSQADDHPVACISWQDAKAYVDWLNAQLKPAKPYRLPTEAEWEYAARGGRYDRFPWGNDLDAAMLNCWSCGDAFDHTSAVGHFPANAYGVHDLSGNQWEWVEDCYLDHYHNASPVGAAYRVDDCRSHVLRGGSWGDNANFLRAAYRVPYQNGYRQQAFGFRLAQDL